MFALDNLPSGHCDLSPEEKDRMFGDARAGHGSFGIDDLASVNRYTLFGYGDTRLCMPK